MYGGSMRPVLTFLLLLVFASVHGLPLKALGSTAIAAVPDTAQARMAGGHVATGHMADQVQMISPGQELTSGCCAAEVSDALTHTGSKCASDCATLLPIPPVLPLPGTLRIHGHMVRPIMATAPPVAGHPPQFV